MNAKQPQPQSRHRAPEGECAYCDARRAEGSTFHPSHDPSPLCRNAAAGRPSEPHCTCDACF